MENLTTPPTGAVTVQHDFGSHGINDKGEKAQDLFSVRAGVPLSDALEQLSGLLSSSICTLDTLACESNDAENMPGALWQSVHLLNFSFALIQSIHGGHNAHTKGQS